MVDTTFLDPEFVIELQAAALLYDAGTEQADDSKWNIARKINAMWPEHKTIRGENGELVYPTKLDFCAHCSTVANKILKRKRFSDSGETLRRWCEVQSTYSEFEHADLFLDVLSFEHLRIAKSLAYNEKVKNPVLALATAQKNSWNADEMRLHYDPPTIPHTYDAYKGKIDFLLTPKSFDFLKITENKRECVRLASEIKRIVDAEIQAEGKAI